MICFRGGPRNSSTHSTLVAAVKPHISETSTTSQVRKQSSSSLSNSPHPAFDFVENINVTIDSSGGHSTNHELSNGIDDESDTNSQSLKIEENACEKESLSVSESEHDSPVISLVNVDNDKQSLPSRIVTSKNVLRGENEKPSEKCDLEGEKEIKNDVSPAVKKKSFHSQR